MANYSSHCERKNMEESLKNCPFCGGKEIVYSGETGKIEYTMENLGYFYCKKCYGRSGGELQTWEESFNHWNTRQPCQKCEKLFEEIINLKKDKRDLESHLESLRSQSQRADLDEKKIEELWEKETGFIISNNTLHWNFMKWLIYKFGQPAKLDVKWPEMPKKKEENQHP